METYKVQESIQDAVRILDSAPLHRDLVYETNVVQLANRVPIAHLAIEQGLKRLLYRAGEEPKQVCGLGHSLNKLYQSLEHWDADSAEFLERAFQDAVTFFGYNVKAKKLGHFRFLASYLSKVGTHKHFTAIRYWVVQDSPHAENLIRFVCLRTHRELLCALNSIFWNTHKTVTNRVDREVADALIDHTELSLSLEDPDREGLAERYMAWLEGQSNPRAALEEGLAEDSGILADNEVAARIIRKAHRKLKDSKDPAVLYYAGTLDYPPKGSHRSDADPKIEWLDKDKRTGEVMTPAGTCLGFIQGYSDGTWEIKSLLGRAVVRSHIDAAHLLINLLTRRGTVALYGESQSVRLVTHGDYVAGGAYTPGSDDIDMEQGHNLEFWDEEHGLQIDRECSIEITRSSNLNAVNVIEGVVTEVSGQKVIVRGHSGLHFGKRKKIVTTTAIARRRRPRGQHPKRTDEERRPKPLPQYLEAHEVSAIIRAADDPRARLLMTEQWRAGLRVSEALALEVADLSLDADQPTIRVRQGKGRKSRIVPVHPELGAAFQVALAYGNVSEGRIIDAHRSTAWRWVQKAHARAEQLGAIPSGREVGTHTFRHSYARHLLMNGIPINYLSRWLGHSSIQTTLIYLELVPDPSGSLASVP